MKSAEMEGRTAMTAGKRLNWILLFTDPFGVLQVVGDHKCNPLTKREAKRLLKEYAKHLPQMAGQMYAIQTEAIPAVPRKGSCRKKSSESGH